MAIFGALSIGRTGLTTQSAALSVIGNNIANVNTVGFKGSRIEFADLLNASGGGDLGKVGLGARVGAVRTLFGQGAIEATGQERDLAIQGEGFFLVGDPDSPRFTRAGNFTRDASGNVVTNEGLPLLAYDVSPATGQAIGQPAPINLEGLGSQSQATQNISLSANIDATAGDPAIPFDPTTFTSAFTTTTHATTLTVFDSLGGGHSMNVFFTRTGTNQWDYDVAIDGAELDPVTGNNGAAPGAAGVPTVVGSGTITFNSDGSLASAARTFPAPAAATTDFAVTFTGASAQPIAMDLGTAGQTDGLSQNAAPFALRAQAQDGFGTGELLGINVTEAGFVEALFSNGQTRVINQLALARFPNKEGLTALGNQVYQVSVDSGDPVVEVAQSGGRGSIISRSLETSNVSIADQFIDLISAQRSFQANTRTITASDQLLQELINIVR
jgi:flagellar hook protein FlgE